MIPIRHTIIGLPQSGKTTFLAALWHLINAEETPTSLVLDQYNEDFSYLNQIAEAWMEFRRVPRTPTDEVVSASISVRIRETTESAVLEFPDLSGESYELQLATRTCTKEYFDGLSQQGGILLFVTAEQRDEGRRLTVTQMNEMLGEESASENAGQAEEWTFKLCPDEVLLIELLQFLQQPPFPMTRRRIGVIVSAWDLVTGNQNNPTRWLSQNMPLLYQFLMSNGDDFDSRIFGVSAQGGDIDTADRKLLLACLPSERVVCIGHDAGDHDLTAPIVWLTRGT